MQDEIVKSLDVFWGQAKVGSYEKFQSGSEQFVYDADVTRNLQGRICKAYGSGRRTVFEYCEG